MTELKKTPGVIGFFFLAFLAVASYYFLHSPFFAVEEVVVQGLEIIPEEEVVRLAGIRMGESIVKLNGDRVGQQVLLHPQVESVDVKRSWPRRIILNITERRPAALILHDSKFVMVDSKSVYLKKVPQVQGAKLPVITGVILDGSLGPGDHISHEGLKHSLSLLNQAPAEFNAVLAEVNAARPWELIFYTVHGIEIRFGSLDNHLEKIQLVKDILADSERNKGPRNIKYIDVTSVSNPSVRYRT